MKMGQVVKGVTRNIAIASLIGCAIVTAIPQPSYASKPTFRCGSTKYRGKTVPATWAYTQNGRKIMIIRWIRSVGKWSARRRCKVVSRKFQVAYDHDKLRYIKGSYLGTEPVLCAVNNVWENCTRRNILFTLHPRWRKNPRAAAQVLLDRRGLAAGRVLNENNSKTFHVDFKSYMEAAAKQK
ncbi:MAG: COP23 domain-containing protein [Calothrix sp. MO_167.B12]|nr:COP23 domain-containing protein [Calothrix sp. MO_167.B12]